MIRISALPLATSVSPTDILLLNRDGTGTVRDPNTNTLAATVQQVSPGLLARIIDIAGTAYTLAMGDILQPTILRTLNAGAVTITVPLTFTNMPIGSSVMIMQYGAGGVTVVGASLVTVRSAASLVGYGRYSMQELIKTDLNEWVFGGNMV